MVRSVVGLILYSGPIEPFLVPDSPRSLSDWSFTICLTPYNRNYNVLSASLNKTFPFFFGLAQN